jgi:hypothetical protein
MKTAVTWIVTLIGLVILGFFAYHVIGFLLLILAAALPIAGLCVLGAAIVGFSPWKSAVEVPDKNKPKG